MGAAGARTWRITNASVDPSGGSAPSPVSTYLQVPDVERLLEDVGGIGAGSQRPHVGQVAAVAPHGLDDEDTALGPAGRLLDAVTRLHRRTRSGHVGHHPTAWP